MSNNYADYEKVMELITAKNNDTHQEDMISNADKEKISQAYFQLFYALTLSHWMRSGTLGQAWYKALEQVKTFISAQDKLNPAVSYMQQLSFSHNLRWSKIMMTNKNKDQTLQHTTEDMDTWKQYVINDVNKALETLKGMIKQYAKQNKDIQKPKQISNKFAGASQNLKILFATMQKINTK